MEGLFTAISERYYTGLRDDPELRIKLSGNFEAIVGEQDTFCMLTRFGVGFTADHHLDHVLEYENCSGLDNAWKKIPGSDVGSISLRLLLYFLFYSYFCTA